MNGVPPMDNRPDDIDESYRRACALDPSVPAETVRRSILAHAAELAAARSAAENSPPFRRERGTAARGWKPALVGSLMAAGLAALLITPFFHVSRPTPAKPSSVVTTPLVNATKRPALAETQALAAQAQHAPKATAAPAPRPSEYASAARAAASAPAPSPSIMLTNESGRALRRAAQSGDIAALRSLLDQHVDLEGRDASGRTALMLATLGGRSESVNELLARGADPNAADARGLTPLHAALAGNFRDIAASLERAGAR